MYSAEEMARAPVQHILSPLQNRFPGRRSRSQAILYQKSQATHNYNQHDYYLTRRRVQQSSHEGPESTQAQHLNLQVKKGCTQSGARCGGYTYYCPHKSNKISGDSVIVDNNTSTYLSSPPSFYHNIAHNTNHSESNSCVLSHLPAQCHLR